MSESIDKFMKLVDTAAGGARKDQREDARRKIKALVAAMLKDAERPKPAEHNDAVERHPEDKAAYAEGKRYGRACGQEFCRQNGDKLYALITTYSDAAATSLLEELREDFWSGEWEKREGASGE